MVCGMRNGTDVFGEAVNISSPLQANAQPGNCLANETKVELAGTPLYVALRSESSMRLKGVPSPVEAFSIDLEGGVIE